MDSQEAKAIANHIVQDRHFNTFIRQIRATEDLDLLRGVLANLPVLDKNAGALSENDYHLQRDAACLTVERMTELLRDEILSVTRGTMRSVIYKCWAYFDLQIARDVFEGGITQHYVHDAGNVDLVNDVIGFVRIGAKSGQDILGVLLKQLA